MPGGPTRRGEHCVMAEAETGLMLRQAGEARIDAHHQKPGGDEEGFYLESQRNMVLVLDF